MSANDTDPNAPLLGPESTTDPGAPPEHANDATTEQQARIEGSELLARFARGNQKPPAPTPDRLPFSDGRPFVAYQTVHKPAVSARPHITDPGVRIDRSLLEQESVPPAVERTTEPSLRRRDAETVELPHIRMRRAVVRGTLGVALLVVALIAVKLALTSRSDGNGPASAVAPSIEASAAPTTSVVAPVTPLATAPQVKPTVVTSAPAVTIDQPHHEKPAAPQATSRAKKPSEQGASNPSSPRDPLQRSIGTIPEDPL